MRERELPLARHVISPSIPVYRTCCCSERAEGGTLPGFREDVMNLRFTAPTASPTLRSWWWHLSALLWSPVWALLPAIPRPRRRRRRGWQGPGADRSGRPARGGERAGNFDRALILRSNNSSNFARPSGARIFTQRSNRQRKSGQRGGGAAAHQIRCCRDRRAPAPPRRRLAHLVGSSSCSTFFNSSKASASASLRRRAGPLIRPLSA